MSEPQDFNTEDHRSVVFCSKISAKIDAMLVTVGTASMKCECCYKNSMNNQWTTSTLKIGLDVM